jgi:C-terminal processing protease CtpA/Prc
MHRRFRDLHLRFVNCTGNSMSRPGRQAVCQRSGSLIAELEASLRALIGPEPSDALLRGLLQTHKNNVAAAANAFYDMSTANGSQQPERIAHFDFSPGKIGIATMDSENGVVVAELIPGSQADVAGVPLLSVLVGIDAISVTDLDRRAIDRIMMVHRRGDEPIRLQFRLPPGAEPPRPLAPPSLPTAATPPPAASQLLRRGGG